METWLIVIAALVAYFFPTVVAMLRHKSNTAAIFVLNLLLGWTAIGWIIALVWALLTDTRASQVIVNNAAPTPPTEWGS